MLKEAVSLSFPNCVQFHREGEATPVNTFSSTLPNPFLAGEDEAPAEPLRT